MRILCINRLPYMNIPDEVGDLVAAKRCAARFYADYLKENEGGCRVTYGDDVLHQPDGMRRYFAPDANITICTIETLAS